MTAIPIRSAEQRDNRRIAKRPPLARLQSSPIQAPEERPLPLTAEIVWERPRPIIVRRETSGAAFDRTIDPYRMCEHGCVFCIAGSPHGNDELLPGLDFEGRLVIQDQAAEHLERELALASYSPAPVVIGASADPYHPVERQYRVTRSLLEVLQRARHPVTIVTKSNLILRDLDILTAMGRDRLVKVFVSVTTLDREVARKMQPHAPSPQKRLEAIEALNDAGVPAGVMVAPIIPAITDVEIETILMRAYGAGAREAGYSVLTLGRELRDAFRERLLAHYPQKLRRAISLMQSMIDDQDRRSAGGARRGAFLANSVSYAWMIKRRFETGVRRLGYRETPAALRTDLFRAPFSDAAGGGAPIIVLSPRVKPRRRPRRFADHAARRQ